VVLDDGTDEVPHDERDGDLVKGAAIDEVDQPFGAEALGPPALGDPVGVEQHAVTGLEGLLVHRADAVTGAPRPRRWPDELPDHLPVADEHRRGVAGVDPVEDAAVEVEAADLARDEAVAAVLGGDDAVDALVDVLEGPALAAVVAVAAEGERGEHRRPQPVAHRVHEGEVELGAVQRIVEAVPADLVGGLEHARHRDARRGEGEGWEQVPLHARRQRHRLPPAMQPVGVGDPALDREREAGEHAEVLALRQHCGVARGKRERQHPGDIGAFDDRGPDARTVGALDRDDLAL